MKSISSIAVFLGSVLAGCAALAPQRDETSGGSAMKTLPKDIYPESRSRLPLPKREALDEHGKRVYDSVLDPKRPTLAGFQGPAGIWLHSPRVGEPIREMNRILRTEVPLEPRLRELAILVTARELDNQFEWTAHEPVALKEGLDPKIIDLVKFRRPVSGAPEKETAIIGFGRELFRDRKVRPEAYPEMVRVFGQTAVMLTAFDQQLHEGRKPLLPLP